MSKIEKEIKVLNINPSETKQKLLNFGAQLIEHSTQKIYTYDVPTIYYRFKEIKALILNEDPIMQQVNQEKFINLAFELFDLLSPEEEESFFNLLNISNINEINNLPLENLQTLLQNNTLDNFFSNFMINENKWVRLRQTNNKTTLTIKHIFDKKVNNIQYVKEAEIVVSDLDEANDILSKIGIISRNYQEKRRTSFTYKTAEIEIDEWPKLNPYMEIESDDEDIINEIVEKLDFKNKEIVSTNTANLYKQIGIDILKQKELRF